MCKGSVVCENCYFFEIIMDGNFCNYFEEVVCLDENCKYYIHKDMVNSILFCILQELFGDIGEYTSVYEFIQDFKNGEKELC